MTLDNNPIKFIGQNYNNTFPELSNLEELNLRNMSLLKQIGEGAFAKLSNLTILRIQNCSHLNLLDANAFSLNVSIIFIYDCK